jgi:hypothetical protein
LRANECTIHFWLTADVCFGLFQLLQGGFPRKQSVIAPFV